MSYFLSSEYYRERVYPAGYRTSYVVHPAEPYPHYIPPSFNTSPPQSMGGSARFTYSTTPPDNYLYYTPHYAYDTTPTKQHPARVHHTRGSSQTFHPTKDEAPRVTTRRRANSSTQESRPKRYPTVQTTRRIYATEKDAQRAGIPAGYSIKNWDPTEKPIILLGSVFDANSLGKWIYDWTIFHHRADSAMTDMAADLWLLLIKLAGKTGTIEKRVDSVKNKKDRETLGKFLSKSAKLWSKLEAILKACQTPMLSAGKKEGSGAMGKNAGIAFVETMFGYTDEHEMTLKLMAEIRTWDMELDAKCEDILRRSNVPYKSSKTSSKP